MARILPSSAGFTGQEVAVIRITELSLPLDYTPEALRKAVVKRLKIPDADLLDFTVFKRSYDARKKNSVILFVYIVDVTVRDEAAMLQAPRARSPGRRSRRTRATTRLRQAPAALDGAAARGGLWSLRTVRRAAAGADGIQAHRAGTRPRRAPPHAGHLGAVAQEHADAGIQRAVRRGRRRPVLGRQALQPDQGPEILRPQGDARIRARRRAGGNPVRQQAAHRHLPPHRRGRRDARGNHRARRRSALRKQGRRIC